MDIIITIANQDIITIATNQDFLLTAIHQATHITHNSITATVNLNISPADSSRSRRH